MEPNTSISDSEFGELITTAQTLLHQAHTTSGAPAMSIAVGLDNKIIWSEALGLADVENQVEASPETVFRIGSVSKGLTSAGLGKLLQRGLLSLDHPVGLYAPSFNHPAITIRQLASHSSGIRNYGSCLCFPIWEYLNTRNFESVESSVAVFENNELLFEPGSDFSYSSYNYGALSLVMEKASGTNFLQFMEDQVFSPLKMTSTNAEEIDTDLQNMAKFYDVLDGKFKETFPVNNSIKWAGGGFVSTPNDLVKLGSALLGDEFLSKSTVDTLFSPQKLSSGHVNPQNYALGWRNHMFDMFEKTRKIQVVHHGGTAAGSTALLAMFPEQKLVIAMTMNRSSQKFPMFEYLLPIAEKFIVQIESQAKE